MATSSPRGPSCQRCAVTATTARDIGAICCGETPKPRMPLGEVPITSEQMAAPKGCVHEPIKRLRNGVCALEQTQLELEQAAGRRNAAIRITKTAAVSSNAMFRLPHRTLPRESSANTVGPVLRQGRRRSNLFCWRDGPSTSSSPCDASARSSEHEPPSATQTLRPGEKKELP